MVAKCIKHLRMLLNFSRFASGTYVGVKLTCKDEEWSRCECEAREGRVPCGDDCLNRLVYTECCPSSCPLGDRLVRGCLW